MRGGGTLHHMAPELVGNYLNKAAGRSATAHDGFACDMWAMGVMLAELLTGKLPFWPKDGFDYQGMHRLLSEWVRSFIESGQPYACIVFGNRASYCVR